MVLFYEDCMSCGSLEERIFRDSWTGLEVCLSCLGPVIDDVTNSPASEEDNLHDLLGFNYERV